MRATLPPAGTTSTHAQFSHQVKDVKTQNLLKPGELQPDSGEKFRSDAFLESERATSPGTEPTLGKKPLTADIV